MVPIKVWYFLGNATCKQLADHKGTYMEKGAIIQRTPGMHGAERILDALRYGCGSVVCRAEIWGDIVRNEDKIVGSHCLVLQIADIAPVMHDFACICAEHALRRAHVTDPRCLGAVTAKRRWLQGEIDDEALSEAKSAAWDAAETLSVPVASHVATYAAWSGVWSAEHSTPWSVAWCAAENAAQSAAEHVAQSAEHFVSWSVAEKVAKSAQNSLLHTMVRVALSNVSPISPFRK